MFDLLKYVDKLPKISICLAAGSKDLRGFPLLHCNKTFDAITGYTRADYFSRYREGVVGLRTVTVF